MRLARKLRNFVYDLVSFASPRTARRKIYRGKVKHGGMVKWAVLAHNGSQKVTRGSVKATTKTAAMKKGRRLLRSAGIDADRVTVKKVAR